MRRTRIGQAEAQRQGTHQGQASKVPSPNPKLPLPHNSLEDGLCAPVKHLSVVPDLGGGGVVLLMVAVQHGVHVKVDACQGWGGRGGETISFWIGGRAGGGACSGGVHTC